MFPRIFSEAAQEKRWRERKKYCNNWLSRTCGSNINFLIRWSATPNISRVSIRLCKTLSIRSEVTKIWPQWHRPWPGSHVTAHEVRWHVKSGCSVVRCGPLQVGLPVHEVQMSVPVTGTRLVLAYICSDASNIILSYADWHNHFITPSPHTENTETRPYVRVHQVQVTSASNYFTQQVH